AAIREADVEAPTPRLKDAVLPSPLAEYVGGGLDKIKWKSAGMGVKQAVLATNDDAVARLLYIPAGTAVPDHGHAGLELTCVLQGAFRDEDMRFARGDIEVATEEVDHTPIADISEDCICLAVTDAPLKFKGWLPRLAQPFLGI
ncbi:MAG: ChrR family anti-sigma-E factor, partial [Pseudomonadota bacterium]|nr:ChrR family anti-sigma-E factor [Pseudomonadota bacterium]